MLTGLRLAIVGGDARMLEVITQVSELDATVDAYGFERVKLFGQDITKRTLHTDTLQKADAIVLPVSGMQDDGLIDTRYADQPLRLGEEHFALLRKSTPIFTGIAKEALVSMTAKHQLSLVKLMEHDDVAIRNSIPTAEGTLALMMEHTAITIHSSHCVVLGFGRTAVTLSRLLKAVGAQVSIVARNPADLARAFEMGLTPYDLASIEQALVEADVIVNTIPALVLTSAVLSHVDPQTLVIDIATTPGGTDFRFAEKRGIQAILAPSLPGIVAPKTAGKILARALIANLHERLKANGGEGV